jgi:dienelactone hydrolase
VYSSNASGTWEIYAWDRADGSHRQVTDRPSGTHSATISPDGEWLWWFDDTDGDEFGRWVSEPFVAEPFVARPSAGASAASGPPASGPPEPGAPAPGAPASGPPASAAVPLPAGAEPDVLDGYSAGLEIGESVVVLGTATDDGSTIWLSRDGEPATVFYTHTEDAGIGALSYDESLLAISHSEHGDSRHPDIRVLRCTDGPDGPDGPTGSVVGELSDGAGKGLSALGFPPIAGDARLLVGHERRGRDELLIWDVVSGEQTELAIDLPGDLGGDFYPDGAALLIAHTHAGRTRLHRYDLSDGSLAELDTAPGCIGSAGVRPDGVVEYGCSSAASPPSVRALHPDGTDVELLAAAGERAPGSVAVTDAWVPGPGGVIHALVATPPGGTAPFPAVFSLHGGPHAADEDRFDAVRAAWVDAGFVVIEVNYRGSTGYGSAWRDAIEGRPGLTELEDVAAVQDWAISSGLVDAARCAVDGWSWGGYLTLLALGTQPGRWARGVAGVPVADYLTAYADEMEQLRAFDRALFGGSPEELPALYTECSPLTYIESVRAPVLVLAGENDPRCPIQQVDNYLDALAALPDPPEYRVLRFDAGHGSLVIDEHLRYLKAEIAFCQGLVDDPDLGSSHRPTPGP